MVGVAYLLPWVGSLGMNDIRYIYLHSAVIFGGVFLGSEAVRNHFAGSGLHCGFDF